MVVDDDRDTLAITALMLKRNGYQVHAYDHPQKALEHLASCKECNIVISDIKMPNMTGIELAKYVKDDFPRMKFVLMSSMPVRKAEWRTILPFSQNVDDFISKPFSIEELIDIIRKHGKEQQKFYHL
jgi:DNA-binding NtrC family response regulator